MSVIQVGETAAPIDLKTHTGASWSLAEAREKQNVVLAFYPFAFSGT